MKKILMVAIVLIAVVSCSTEKNEPKLSYVIPDYVQPNDWKSTKTIKDSVIFYQVEKKVKLNSDYFPGVSDSTKFKMWIKSGDVKKLPHGDTLSSKLFTSLIESKIECNNVATFNPKIIEVGLTDWDGTPCYSINIKFLASNAYGTPSELKGAFYYDLKTNKKITSLVY